MQLLFLAFGGVALLGLALVAWAACAAISQHIADRRAAKTGDFLLEDPE